MRTKPELIVKLAKGDPSAFKKIFLLLYPRMLGYCKLFIKDHCQAEDLVQDCFVKLWNNRKTLHREGNIDKLLFVMLRNHCLNFLRDNKISDFTVAIDNHNINKLQQLYNINFLGEEDKPLEEHIIISVRAAIENLPERQREVFQKAKIKGQNQKEVAAELGITIKAVEKNIASAKKRIREEISRKYPTFLFILFFLFT